MQIGARYFLNVGMSKPQRSIQSTEFGRGDVGSIRQHNKKVRMFSRLGANSYTMLGEFPAISRGKITAYSCLIH
jgi:hypothetical protein